MQQLLGLKAPDYAHVPLLVEPDGKKLAKSTRGVQLDSGMPLPLIIKIFDLLNLSPPPEIGLATIPEAWGWAIERWNIDRVPKRLTSLLAR